MMNILDHDLEFYSSYLEVDLGVIRQNAQRVAAKLAPQRKLFPIVKGNAHGMGTVPVTSVLIEDVGVDILGCAQICEAAKIRAAGYDQVEILLLSGVPYHALPDAVAYDLQVPVYTIEGARRLSEAVRQSGKTAHKVQIKVNTGMNRIGVAPGTELEALIDEILSLGNLEIVGIYTHFRLESYCVGSQETLSQYALFETSVEALRAKGVEPVYVHCCSSGAALWLDDRISNYARVGCMVVGDYQMIDGSPTFGSEQALSWHAFINAVYDLPPGTPVGYGSSTALDRPRKVATISVGFCDGLYIPLVAAGAPLIVNGQYAQYLSIAMDQTIIDVTGIDCAIGDEVTLYGHDKSGIFLHTAELAKYVPGSGQTSLHAYLNDRVKRIYLDSGAVMSGIYH